ncbi:hypothetical protein I6N90_08340 [Paenibacillus sp. GSMTC-2017]|uniref:hypothetical protein n=1 Tax=Paenibacillus sp. GSMTC-2017 TaxID=2794350 RepID=UPI0018D6467F|nr:hypothetical protein [Paenibacillus sp. GSMTC-2017]MBH5317811.1 hypothetical protein [Paenibacillus sp. GSMTC-2017]
MTEKKQIGYGSLSLVLLVLGFMFNYKFSNDFIVSYSIFHALQLDIYSKGDEGIHYPVLASILFWIPALVVAKKYPNDFGAKLSQLFATMLTFLYTIAVVLALAYYFLDHY